MKLIYCLIILLWPFVSTGQKVKALTIGDKAPDIIISNVYNSSVSKMHLSDLKGKLVILDFMATTCVPCIKVLPRFDSLQQQYGGHLQIILVSAERSERIQGFLKKKKSLKLPFAADSNASRYFPHTFISHVAWINAEGVVCAITHTEYVNSKNIQTVLNGQKVNWPVKRDIPEYDYRKHLLKFNESIIPNEALPAHYYYTAIVSYLPGVQKHNKVIEDSVNNLTHISLINFSVLELYKILFRRFQIPLSHILLDEKTKEQLIYNPASEYFEMWKRDHVHCLEATLPIHLSASQQRAKLIQDVGFYFGLKALVEKRSVECIVLKNKQVPRKKTTATNGLTLASVVGTLNNQLNAIPVIDETRGTVYLRLPLTENEVKLNSSLRKILNDFGIELSTEKRTIEFLLINQTHQTPTY